jgi:hypothetical protein
MNSNAFTLPRSADTSATRYNAFNQTTKCENDTVHDAQGCARLWGQAFGDGGNSVSGKSRDVLQVVNGDAELQFTLTKALQILRDVRLRDWEQRKPGQSAVTPKRPNATRQNDGQNFDKIIRALN